MVTENMQKTFANLAIRQGINLQEGQSLIIGANVRDAAFVRMCVEEAYAAGAKKVMVDWRDELVTRTHYLKQSTETLCDIPDWIVARETYRQGEGCCFLSIKSDIPGVNKDVDPEKMQALSQASAKKMGELNRFYMTNRAQWCVISLPSTEWAKVVFPELPEEEAMERLSDLLYAVSRVREGEDALQEWAEHNATLMERAKKMNDFNFHALHFKSEQSGTDLTVGLVKDHIWSGGGSVTQSGIRFNPNIPTEEIFTMPSRTRMEGYVKASMPLDYQGGLIKGLWLKVKDGRVTEHGADEGEDRLAKLLDTDEGTRSFGEVALVPYDSPISQSGILFYKTLYDENASCHLALGRPYPKNLKGGEGMSIEELKAHDANESDQHVDFMFGTQDMQIDGLAEDGTRTPVFREGNFVF
ncbi:MAG: aminopeptidase [Lachnospiraceae bacterium]|nr:aminopeptidase [Lachnospiraceae bacterium]